MGYYGSGGYAYLKAIGGRVSVS